MSKQKLNAEEYRVICGILLAIILFLVWQWNQSENHRVKLVEELTSANDTIEELERKIDDLNETISWYEEQSP